MKTYTLTADHPRHGRAGTDIQLNKRQAKYLVMAGTVVEKTAKTPAPRKAAKAASKDGDA